MIEKYDVDAGWETGSSYRFGVVRCNAGAAENRAWRKLVVNFGTELFLGSDIRASRSKEFISLFTGASAS